MNNKSNKYRVSIWLGKELYKQYEEEAQKKQIPITTLIKEILIKRSEKK